MLHNPFHSDKWYVLLGIMAEKLLLAYYHLSTSSNFKSDVTVAPVWMLCIVMHALSISNMYCLLPAACCWLLLCECYLNLTTCLYKAMEHMVNLILSECWRGETFFECAVWTYCQTSTPVYLVNLQHHIQNSFVIHQHIVTVSSSMEKVYDTTQIYGICRAFHQWNLGTGYHCVFETFSKMFISMPFSAVFICALSPRKWNNKRIYFKHDYFLQSPSVWLQMHWACMSWHCYILKTSTFSIFSGPLIPLKTAYRSLFVVCHTQLWRMDFHSLWQRLGVCISPACAVHISSSLAFSVTASSGGSCTGDGWKLNGNSHWMF